MYRVCVRNDRFGAGWMGRACMAARGEEDFEAYVALIRQSAKKKLAIGIGGGGQKLRAARFGPALGADQTGRREA